jgi:hypothetical protein
MKLIIDSEPVEIANLPKNSFSELCKVLMDRLLPQDRSITSCKLDGAYVTEEEDADARLAAAQLCEVATVPLQVAFQTAVALQCQNLRKLEDDCETFVTDILLDEPGQVADNWKNLCVELKAQVNFIPHLASFMTEKQLEGEIEKQLGELNEIISEAGRSFATADVVTVSDIIELRLLPWLRQFRESLAGLLEKVKNSPAPDPT